MTATATLQTYTHGSEGRDRDAAETVDSLSVPRPTSGLEDEEDQSDEHPTAEDGDPIG